MNDFSDASDVAISQLIWKQGVDRLVLGYKYRSANECLLDDFEFCLKLLIKYRLEFIPLELGFEVRAWDDGCKKIIVQNDSANRAICECYLMLKISRGVEL